jgi:dienelactone hydrolase
MVPRIAGLIIALLLASAAQAQTAGETQITFPSVLRSTPIPATLIRPDGEGPFPAIVIVHDCSGLGPRSSGAPRRWAQELIGHGYVILIPDSFGPRDLPNGVCTAPLADGRRAHYAIRAGDALGALAALRALSYVDGNRIGIMGGSHGGATTLATIVEPLPGGGYTEAKKKNFAAGIALYPRCDAQHGNWNIAGRQNGNNGPPTGYTGVFRPLAPLLILTGEKDDWTPAEPCLRMTEAAQAAGHPLEIKIYPGAHHSFDSSSQVRFVTERNNPNSPTGKWATTGGDLAARQDAKKQVVEFFARYLKAER